jgi:phospholipid/cholesterol/gamma-HCH transport system substrate-binding protein
MKRSTFITWEQLKVGGLILLALAITAVATFRLGQAANLFEKRYELIAFLGNASGLREGGSVTVAGQLAGTIKSIVFLPPGADSTHSLKLTLQINESLQPQIRGDSRARVRTLGLLGDKVIDVSVGTPRYAVLPAGATLRTSQSLDYDEVIAEASGAVGDMVQLTADLRKITSGIVQGKGTMGRLLTDRTLYDQLTATLAGTDRLLGRLERPNGTFGRMVDDPTLYDRLTSLTGSLDSLLRAVNSPQGTVGKLLTNDSLYTRIVGVTAGVDTLVRQLRTGNGFASRVLTDQQLYDRLNKLVTDLTAIVEDVRADPRKYTRGMVNVKVF